MPLPHDLIKSALDYLPDEEHVFGMRRVSTKWLIAVADWVECRFFGSNDDEGLGDPRGFTRVAGRFTTTSRQQLRVFLCTVADMTFTLRYSVQCVDLSCLSTEGNKTIQKLVWCISTSPALGETGPGQALVAPPLGATTELVLSQTKVTYVPNLSCCPMLRKLVLKGCMMLTNEGLQQISSAPALEELDLSHTQVTILRLLSTCRRLRKLALRDCPKLTSESLGGIELIPTLEELDLSYTHVTWVGWLWLCPALTTLNLTGCMLMTTQETRGLERIAKLKVLLIAETNIKSVEHLSCAKYLTTLDLSQCWELTDAGIVGLERIPTLTDLNLARTQVSWGRCCYMGFQTLKKLSVELCQHRVMGTELVEYRMLQELLHQIARGIPTLKVLRFFSLNGMPLVATSLPTLNREAGTRLAIRFAK